MKNNVFPHRRRGNKNVWCDNTQSKVTIGVQAMRIQESAENYLEAIFILKQRKGYVRSIDIATELGYSKPSVSRAMKLLRENDYISVAEDGTINLTETGQTIAEQMYERHSFLAQFLMGLGLDEKIAKEDACRIEHVICEETFERLKAFIEQKTSG